MAQRTRVKLTSAVDTHYRAKKPRRAHTGKTHGGGGHDSVRVYIVSTAGHGLPSMRGAAKTPMFWIRTEQALVEEFRAANRQAVWVAPDPESIAPLAAEAPVARGQQRLLVLDEMKEVTHHLFSALFRYVVTATGRLKLLDFAELIEVLASPDRKDLFIGGAVDRERGVVLLYRGNVEPLVVPLAWFANRSSNVKANPNAFAVIDYGQTVKLGAFEAATDAILYEFDAEYRRKAKKRALDQDSSFGAAVRRLRLQKGLARSDFPGLSERAVARIERNEIRHPRASTLEKVASTLGVFPNDLASY